MDQVSLILYELSNEDDEGEAAEGYGAGV
jgi:hypothetical protein